MCVSCRQWRCSLLISLWVVKVYSTYRGQWRRILRIPLWAVKVYFVYTIVGGEGVFYLSWTVKCILLIPLWAVKVYSTYRGQWNCILLILLLTVTVYFTYYWQWRCILLIIDSDGVFCLYHCAQWGVLYLSHCGQWSCILPLYDILDTQGVFYYYEQSRCILLSHCGNECVFHWELSEGVLNYLIMAIKWKCILLISLWELGEGVFYLSHCGN